MTKKVTKLNSPRSSVQKSVKPHLKKQLSFLEESEKEPSDDSLETDPELEDDKILVEDETAAETKGILKNEIKKYKLETLGPSKNLAGRTSLIDKAAVKLDQEIAKKQTMIEEMNNEEKPKHEPKKVLWDIPCLKNQGQRIAQKLNLDKKTVMSKIKQMKIQTHKKIVEMRELHGEEPEQRKIGMWIGRDHKWHRGYSQIQKPQR